MYDIDARINHHQPGKTRPGSVAPVSHTRVTARVNIETWPPLSHTVTLSLSNTKNDVALPSSAHLSISLHFSLSLSFSHAGGGVKTNSTHTRRTLAASLSHAASGSSLAKPLLLPPPSLGAACAALASGESDGSAEAEAVEGP